jgi:hypothetical protein
MKGSSFMDKDAFKRELENEINNLERLNGEMSRLLNIINDTPDFIETRAAGSIVHDFYCAVERIFERISVQIDGGLPAGEDWHTELLTRMAKPGGGRLNNVISEPLMKKLKEFLRFRHLFRHIYGFELKWERFRSLAESMSEILNELKTELQKFGESPEP